MWTWQFQLDDILTTLSIVVLIGGASYRYQRGIMNGSKPNTTKHFQQS